MYGAASIGERQQGKLQYTCIAGFMRLNFPSERLIKTVNGDPSNHSSDQEVINAHTGTHKNCHNQPAEAIISLHSCGKTR